MIVRYNIEDFWSQARRAMFALSELGQIIGRLPMQDGVWIAGGAVRRAAMGQPLGDDIDIFLRADVVDPFNKDMRAKFPLIGSKCTDRRKAYDISDLKADVVIGQAFPTATDVLADFDFRCCCFATDGRNLWLDPLALVDAQKKVLCINNPKKLSHSLHHAERYMRAGYRAEPPILDELLKYGRDERAAMRPEYSGK